MLIPRPHEIKKSGSILKNKAIGKVENAFSPLLFRHYKDMILADDSSPTILEIKQDLSVENEEEYHLIIKENRIQIISKTEKAAFYGLITLKQLRSEQIIETQDIKDKPDLEVRGLMLDISRAKVLNVSSIKKIIDLIAELKYNHLELYVEGFSYEYKNIKEALADKNYLTQEEYLEVEKYANEKYIDFVPNQNGFGHMSDWLALDKFKELAECPDGFEIWGSKRPPSTLDPTNPKSFELVKQMYEELALLQRWSVTGDEKLKADADLILEIRTKELKFIVANRYANISNEIYKGYLALENYFQEISKYND